MVVHPDRTSDFDDDPDFKISKRAELPTDYTLKIESFSKLSDILQKTKSGRVFESGNFKSGGYKWKLLLYPKGDLKSDGEGHISLYLATAEEAPDFEINVRIKLFIYDQIRDQYLTVKDRRTRRYHALKTQHGFPKLISLKSFADPSNGYLVDDCCAFGAEVRVLKCKTTGDKVSVLKQPEKRTYTWKIEKFSKLPSHKSSESEVFSCGGRKWELSLYPKGDLRCKHNYLSLFLQLHDRKNYPRQKVCAEFKLVIKDQLQGKHFERTCRHHWFHTLDRRWGWGYPEFMQLSDLHNASKGFIVKNTLIIEVEVTIVSIVDGLS